ncbi:CHC2 zinc finger domain-containing protein [uncultured Enterococcus sp.]|uniref:CHC2 zinc finger domain-containing protein n=1 Tax=uncultured Enterococcus sp. TaxID=167972 RepID=UPI002AA7A74D|nr:CHC2 zinc finger domain-containing protein [uncultured Enterococcus sp.]
MAAYDPNKLKNLAKQKNILDVASSLGLELKRVGRKYVWTEHPSFKIDPEHNCFSWFSKGNEFLGQDVIKMVEVINQMSFQEALHYLLEAEAGTFDKSKVPEKEPFVYRVREAKSFDYARKYLKEERDLSDETIDFFLV